MKPIFLASWVGAMVDRMVTMSPSVKTIALIEGTFWAEQGAIKTSYGLVPRGELRILGIQKLIPSRQGGV